MRAVIVTNIPTPYRIPVYERVAAHDGLDLRIVYLAERESNRHWILPATTVRSSVLRSTVVTWRGRYIHLTRGVWGALSRLRPDVVVTTGFNPPQLVAFVYCVVRRVPHVVQTDGTVESEARLGRIHRLVRRIEARRSRSFIAASASGLTLMRSWGAAEQLLHRSPLAIDNAAFERHRDDVKDVDLLFSGQLSAIKNPLFALEVASRAARGLGRRMRIAFVGDGPLRTALLKLAAELEQTVEVLAPGFQQQADLPAWYGRSRVFLFPTTWDPWGLVANEACAAGVPQIVSPFAGSAGELVIDGVNGFVRPLDEAVWAECVMRLLGPGDVDQGMSDAAVLRVREYSFDAAAAGIRAAVDQAARP